MLVKLTLSKAMRYINICYVNLQNYFYYLTHMAMWIPVHIIQSCIPVLKKNAALELNTFFSCVKGESFPYVWDIRIWRKITFTDKQETAALDNVRFILNILFKGSISVQIFIMKQDFSKLCMSKRGKARQGKTKQGKNIIFLLSLLVDWNSLIMKWIQIQPNVTENLERWNQFSQFRARASACQISAKGICIHKFNFARTWLECIGW